MTTFATQVDMPYSTQTDQHWSYWKYIYILYSQGTGLYKIGISKNVKKRIRQLAYSGEKTVGSGDKTLTELASWQVYNLQFAFDMERHLHVRLEKRRIRGEWFSLTDVEVEQLIEYITRVLKRAKEVTGCHPYTFGWSCDAIALFPVDYHVLEHCRMFKGWGRPET